MIGLARRAADAVRAGCARALHATGKLYCGVCEKSVRAFVPLPDFYREQLAKHGWPYSFEQAETCHAAAYSCPRCGAADRDRLLALAWNEIQPTLPPDATLIDFAPAAALSRFLRRTLLATAHYRRADLFAAGVDDRIDITAMPEYANASVDLFLCSHVLEHVADDRAAMRELFRILKPGGRGLLLVPIILGLDRIDEDPTITDSAERWRRFGQDDHVRLYSKEGFVERLTEAGLVVHQGGAAEFGPDVFARQSIAPRSVLYIVEKPAGGKG